ncbi:MAG: DUF4261 domain-containing protein [Verrucomicrobiaceae bacterium]
MSRPFLFSVHVAKNLIAAFKMTQVFFSQCIAVLCSEAPGLAELRLILEREGYTIKADEDVSNWPEMQGAGLTLATDFENGATCWVDICEFPWPDNLGVTGDPTLVTGAHMMGAFGPFAHPGAFERALQAPGYQSTAPDARQHRAFVRFRISNLIPASEGAAEASFASVENANPAWEIAYLLRVAASLRAMPAALAYFNPNSELLLSMQGLADILTFAFEQKTYPIEAVCRVRGCPVDDAWSLVDSIGMEQAGLRDHEFAWANAEVSRQEQLEFLINLLHYQIDHSAPMLSGHTTDGPHNKLWRAEEREASCMIPERKVLHWTMDGSPPEPSILLVSAPVFLTSDKEDEVSAEMQEIQAKIQAWLDHRDAIFARAAAWLRSLEFLNCFYDDAHVPLAFKVALEAEMSKKEARETWEQLQYMGQQTPKLWNQYQQLGVQGQIWLAVPLMVNPMFKKEVNTMLPCGVVVATEQTAKDIMLAGLFAHAAYSTYTGESDPKKHPGIARMLANDEFRLFYREMFPVDETQGMRLLYMSIMLRNSWMPPSDVPFIPLLAMPGPHGAVIQIPWHVVMDMPAPPDSVKPGKFAEIGQIDRRADQMVADAKRERYAGFVGKLRYGWDVFTFICSILFWIGVAAGVIMAIMRGK